MVQGLQCYEEGTVSARKVGCVTITEEENLESDPKEDKGMLITPVSCHFRSNKEDKKKPTITLQLHPSSFHGNRRQAVGMYEQTVLKTSLGFKEEGAKILDL